MKNLTVFLSLTLFSTLSFAQIEINCTTTEGTKIEINSSKTLSEIKTKFTLKKDADDSV